MNWYVEAVIHANVPAETADDALGLVCDYIRDGIGDEPEPDERKWGTAIAAAYIWDPEHPERSYVVVNEEYQARPRPGRPA